MESRTGICTYVTVLTSKNGDGQEFHLNHLYLKATLLYSAALSLRLRSRVPRVHRLPRSSIVGPLERSESLF